MISEHLVPRTELDAAVDGHRRDRENSGSRWLELERRRGLWSLGGSSQTSDVCFPARDDIPKEPQAPALLAAGPSGQPRQEAYLPLRISPACSFATEKTDSAGRARQLVSSLTTSHPPSQSTRGV